MSFDGLGMNMGNLSRLSRAKSRSISPENPTGEKGKGGMATEGTGAEFGREAAAGHIEGKEIVKSIVVPGRLVNFVVRG